MSFTSVVFPLPDAPTMAVTFALWYLDADAVEGLTQRMGIVFEHHVFDFNALCPIVQRAELPRAVLVLHTADLVDAFQGYTYVLQRIDKVDELTHRRVELSDDVLHGKHHAERHLPVYYGRCSHDGDDDALWPN